ncbi:hypothetical protein QAD02_024220 [Eretmocerus hayati]|uniref:Uncharacterized protein n=1 Tax=Eretmocerus hayati TaxID=131215 RepID=A0ACC2Q2Y2_9HYME|nr:hypothetical protein QAD02_024220 [Eretmocerus hayati]
MDNNGDLKNSIEDMSKINFEFSDALGETKPNLTETSQTQPGTRMHPAYDEPVPSSYRILKPKDVISWISTFDGTGNVRVFIKEIEESLQQMENGLDRKCVFRMVIANKLMGLVKDLIESQEVESWRDMKELLMNY